ncbi:L-histidine N(alpha)-methyltransferase [Mucilaginibacter sp. UR6-11]|uniref:L-histidine N(alpha)-methyltransferase n=1 Tax=Mucilaginibacter sp. UR6-11 TaxID=1435644 RepID=UPI001E44730F|nr:L-histidine N(alpha)-methyltransferase [Mucilaginibacter sp. UR6-11]MCC8424709.1 L-histidine N(alpha)-methyltransferase [Mucilaginibacter sp. UR6-11]
MNQPSTQPAMIETSKSDTETFYNDVIKGLKQTPKRLNSMYFYDAAGDKLFQELMDCPEYYPTKCELEIFSQRTADLANTMIGDGDAFDLIELGAGDATKSSYLLKYLQDQGVDFTYLPIDISANVINYLTVKLPLTIPGLKMTGLNGQYFDMLKRAAALSNRRKVVLFLGSNIGNMPVNEATDFCKELRHHLAPGDMALIGFDLKKSPKTILAAYNDKGGITKKFNFNLLHRINRELDANFDVNRFDHYPMYDPETGACKSYLISLQDQLVTLGKETIRFVKDEYIYMEISQKFTIMQTDQMAAHTGFRPLDRFFDNKKWFVDTIWIAE